MGMEPPGVAERAIDTAADVSRKIQEVTDALRIAVNRLRATVNRAQRRGEPLAQLRAVTLEAPLTSLSVAFLLGVAFARRR